ncbi:hypothetical protein HDU98_006860 [Podochytrium sp. JEL0797]|nr:hypothetical protein HDU98_006860 [Podochytrium sp. JEL0797]
MDTAPTVAALDALLALTNSASDNTGTEAAALFTLLCEQQASLLDVAARETSAHQQRQALLATRQQRVAAAEQRIQGLVSALEAQQRALQQTIAKAKQHKETAPKDKHTHHAQVVHYARRLAKYSSQNTNPMIHSMPPIPQDAHMKRGLLFARLDVAVAGDEKKEEDTSQEESLMERDVLSKLVMNPAHASHNDDMMDEEDELNLDL